MHDTLQVHFIELPYDGKLGKSGDAVLILFPDGSNLLVDCGIKETFPALDAYLKAKHITKLDAFVASHPHIDHIGAFPLLSDAYPIGSLYRIPPEMIPEFHSVSLTAMEEAVKKHTLHGEYLHEGMRLERGGVDISILGPWMDSPLTMDGYEALLGMPLDPSNAKERLTHLTNDISTCMRMQWGKASFLTCGDLYFTAEMRYLEHYGNGLQVTLAKADHHGAYTSNTKKWIEAVHAEVVVASRNCMPPAFPTDKPERDAYFAPHYDGYAPLLYPQMGSEFHLTFEEGSIIVSLEKDGTYTVDKSR